ncbi:hypothetical protein TSUD_137930 [Trifolium subterraneum]|uniref:Uncharacterized protein n=1 Tax=Trifolium subterraneum TaxID=3900 RepID=A0A2Z6PQP0_TRISU|nr:hypothetical protein TSUD_137930 [Trifolium subterraneum]
MNSFSASPAKLQFGISQTSIQFRSSFNLGGFDTAHADASTDSHTTSAGAFGQFAIGVGNTDAAFILELLHFIKKTEDRKFLVSEKMLDTECFEGQTFYQVASGTQTKSPSWFQLYQVTVPG